MLDAGTRLQLKAKCLRWTLGYLNHYSCIISRPAIDFTVGDFNRIPTATKAYPRLRGCDIFPRQRASFVHHEIKQVWRVCAGNAVSPLTVEYAEKEAARIVREQLT